MQLPWGEYTDDNLDLHHARQVLDEEAMAMLRSAQPQVQVPSALRGKAFTLEIPVSGASVPASLVHILLKIDAHPVHAALSRRIPDLLAIDAQADVLQRLLHDAVAHDLLADLDAVEHADAGAVETAHRATPVPENETPAAAQRLTIARR